MITSYFTFSSDFDVLSLKYTVGLNSEWPGIVLCLDNSFVTRNTNCLFPFKAAIMLRRSNKYETPAVLWDFTGERIYWAAAVSKTVGERNDIQIQMSLNLMKEGPRKY